MKQAGQSVISESHSLPCSEERGKKANMLLVILFCGSLWGISEALLGRALGGIPHGSVAPTIIGFFLLAIARSYLPKPGSSVAIGAVATLYRIATMHSFACHLWGVFLVGVSFDIVATLLARKTGRLRWVIASGPLSAYLNYALFAFTMAYLFKYSWWVAGGMPKILGHISVSGSLAAAGALFFVPLGYKVSSFLKVKGEYPMWFLRAASGVTLFIWLGGVGISFWVGAF